MFGIVRDLFSFTSKNKGKSAFVYTMDNVKVEVRWNSVTHRVKIREPHTLYGGWKEVNFKNCNPEYSYYTYPTKLSQAMVFAKNCKVKF